VNKTMMAIIPVVIIAIIAGLGFSGVINIPGLTPAKKAKNAQAGYADKDDKLAQNKAATPTAPPKKQEAPKKEPPKVAELPKKNPDQGADALAAVWNEIKIPELAKITANWKDEDLVKVLMHMDTDKVAKLLTQIATGDSAAKIDPKPERASKLSKILQDQGSVVKLES
jgi:hypothetical protein